MLTAVQVRVYRALPPSLRRLAVRMATPSFTVGVLGLITVDGSQVLLVRPSYRSGWVPPGGFVNRHEEPLAAMSRELQEELGLELMFAPWHRVAYDAHRQSIAFVGVATLPEERDITPTSAEILECRWFPLDGLPPMPNDFYEGMPAEDLAAIRRAGT